VIASKQTGYEDALAGLVADAILPTMPSADKAASVVVDNVRVCKIVGGNPLDSQVVQGVVVQRDTDGSVKHVEKARIAVFGCSIEASSSETKGVVVIKSPEELMQYNKGEERLMEETIKGIADAGATVVIAGGSISEIAMHFLEKYRIMAVRIPSKFELRRLCKAVGAAQLVRVGAPSEAEMGYADQVSVQELSSRLVTVFRQLEGEDSGISTIVLRGATMNMLDDMERAVDDAVHTARQLCKDARLIPGGGASEMELAHRLHAAADACKGLEMYSMHKFAESCEWQGRVGWWGRLACACTTCSSLTSHTHTHTHTHTHSPTPALLPPTYSGSGAPHPSREQWPGEH
jgi:T-complex protein 1 subunit theta